ncbi:PhoH family protein [Aurantivibrio plasticivorans]
MDSHLADNSTAQSDTFRVSLEPNNARRLANLCGQYNQHLRQIEDRLNVDIRNRGNLFVLRGENYEGARVGAEVLEHLYAETESDDELTPDKIHLALQQAGIETLMESKSEKVANATPAKSNTQNATSKGNVEELTLIRTKKCTVKARGKHQQQYVRAIQTNDINFGVGPAGTGKTYLAVACAVESLLGNHVERIVLVRPAVEAGEKLGFLPGDLSQKVDPYLRPLYDALFEMLGFETVEKLIERNVIEIAPLAYMRGRTLNNCFVILDESQNTTPEQMKMFLTRIGFGSTAVINGDPTQVDLPRNHKSGLSHVSNILNNVKGISFTYFDAKDVVRHPLVQRIVEAYDAYESDNKDNPKDE